MKVTNRVGARLKNSKLMQRLGAQALSALDQLSELSLKAQARRATKDALPNLNGRFVELRQELQKVLEAPPAGSREAQVKVGRSRKMPEVIHTSGGKRVPAAVAKRAVKRSGSAFKPKKGQK